MAQSGKLSVISSAVSFLVSSSDQLALQSGMPKERKALHDDEHAGSCTTSTQAAAAWSWFQHGGGTSTSQTEGSRLAQRQQTGLMSGIVNPSRFKIEAEKRMVSATDHDSGCRKLSPDGAMESCTRRRRHSFHHEILRTPTLISTRSPSVNHEQWSYSSDCKASSLFDSFELEAVSKQLEETLTDGRSVPTSTTSRARGDKAGASLLVKAKFPADNHRTDSHKVAAGMRDQSGLRYKHENHHHHHALLHQFFHFRMPAPFCKSIDIANSNVNILHTAPAEGAPKKPRHKQSHEADPLIKHSKHSGRNINPDYNLVNHPDDEHNSRKKVHKLPHHAIHLGDLFSKVSQPLIHLPQSLLSHLHVDHGSNTDLGTNHQRSDANHHRSNTDLGTNHHHFHHHKHFYHHHLHYHHHDVHRLHAENGGRKLEQEIFYPQHHGDEYPSIVDDQSRFLVPRLVYKSQH